MRMSLFIYTFQTDSGDPDSSPDPNCLIQWWKEQCEFLTQEVSSSTSSRLFLVHLAYKQNCALAFAVCLVNYRSHLNLNDRWKMPH